MIPFHKYIVPILVKYINHKNVYLLSLVLYYLKKGRNGVVFQKSPEILSNRRIKTLPYLFIPKLTSSWHSLGFRISFLLPPSHIDLAQYQVCLSLNSLLSSESQLRSSPNSQTFFLFSP